MVGRETFDAVYSKLWMTAFISAAGNMYAVRGDLSSSSTAFTARVQSIPGSARAIGRSVAADRTLAIGWPGGRQPGRASVSARILRVRAARERARERRRDRHASRRPRSERRAADPLEGTRSAAGVPKSAVNVACSGSQGGEVSSHGLGSANTPGYGLPRRRSRIGQRSDGFRSLHPDVKQPSGFATALLGRRSRLDQIADWGAWCARAASGTRCGQESDADSGSGGHGGG